MTIRDRLKQIKQSDAAALLKVSRPYVAQLASGSRHPSIEILARISARLGLSDEEIGASVREMCPAAFAPATPDAA